MKPIKIATFLLFGYIICPGMILAQDSDYRPDLFFREDWKEIPAENPVNQKHVANPDLILELHGPGIDSIKKSNHPKPVDDPYYIWSGACLSNWALSLKNKDYFADLTGYAKIKWRSKQAGFHQLHIILRLADGTWLISDQADGSSGDWRIREFNISDIQWYEFNIDLISELSKVEDPDLSRVDQIGFTDLRSGARGPACSRLDWMEVYGRKVAR